MLRLPMVIMIIERRQTARHGDIVVAQTEDGEATLK